MLSLFVATYPVISGVFVVMISLVIGSFLGCAGYRVPRGISLRTPKQSYCPACQTTLGFRDLIPIFSYVLSAGKCRHCGAPVSPRYLVIEVITASLSLMVWLIFAPHISAFIAVCMLWVLLYFVIIRWVKTQ